MAKLTALIVVFAGLLVGVLYLERHNTSPVIHTVPPPSTSTTTAPAVSVHPYGSVTLALSETANFADVSITPILVVEDSRCPMGVYCIQAGTVRLSVALATSLGKNTQTLTLGKKVNSEFYTITLTDVIPSKPQGGKIDASQYKFTFEVGPASTTPVSSAKCYVGGCSGEVCSADPQAISNCMYTPQFACYKTAKCERQTSGQCGWTQTEALKMCLANPPA